MSIRQTMYRIIRCVLESVNFGGANPWTGNILSNPQQRRQALTFTEIHKQLQTGAEVCRTCRKPLRGVIACRVCVVAGVGDAHVELGSKAVGGADVRAAWAPYRAGPQSRGPAAARADAWLKAWGP